ncbi:WhiB family transcriptional regulator [Mycolicibacterium vanbaalenii]|uniref:WhiB family transcriptional regulator n=1 Tax=Mycolicibacterium vanbaalenii TaxID=110539 RepID=UPI002352B410|nr:WhiB family transcriptional regulator [Mycolicibacterium vanbaalenii]
MESAHRILTPTLESWEWQLRGLCRGMPSEVFFTAEHDKGQRRLDHEKSAKQICRACPVLLECRRYAVEAAEPYGIWGATTPQERRSLGRESGPAVKPAS